ncbi:hypothetical protein HKX48_002757 [Thoreauomyces humboldtii]|nr:hypothetical protein HKX48_002757 [Thoreauomyces humboldtii]
MWVYLYGRRQVAGGVEDKPALLRRLNNSGDPSYEGVPDNPALLLRSKSTHATSLAIPQHHPHEHHTPIPNHAPQFPRVQNARTNLDRYRIEQIALRRLRFVIETRQAEPSHISMIDLVERGNVPPTLLSHYFGPKTTTPHDIKVLLLQAIHRPSQSPHMTLAPSTSRRPATTPDSVLHVLAQAERRARPKTSAGGGRRTIRREVTAPGVDPGLEVAGVAVGGAGGAASVKKLRDVGQAVSGKAMADLVERRRTRHLKL